MTTLLQTDPLPGYEEEQDLIRQLKAKYELSKSNRDQRQVEWMRNERILKNQAENPISSQIGVRANEVFPAITARIAWMTDQGIECEIVPAANPWNTFGYLVATIQATHLEDLINSVYYGTHWYLEIIKMLWDEASCGIGFVKAGWDSGKLPGHGPTSQPLGQVTCQAVSPWSLYLDPYGKTMTDIRWICQVHTMTGEEMERRFPAVSPDLIAQTSRNAQNTTTHVPPSDRGAQAAGPQLVPINAGSGPMTWGPPGGAKIHNTRSVEAQNVYEMWWKENYFEEVTNSDPELPKKEPVVSDRWRVTCWSGSKVLLDEYAYDIFGQDTHPFVRYVSSAPNAMYNPPLMRFLAPCQIYLNHLLAMAQNNIEYTGNPVLVATKGSGVDRSTWINRPGQIYDVNGGPQASQNKPDWMQPPNLPATLMNLANFWRDEIERISGLQGPQRGSSTPSRSSNNQVQATQEAGFVRIRGAQRSLEITLSELFTKVAQIICINYDTPRTVAILGPQSESTTLQLSARHFMSTNKNHDAPLRFTLRVNAGADKPTSRAARFTEAKQLKEIGAVDGLYVAEAAGVKNAPSVYARMQNEQQAEARAIQEAKLEKGQSHEK